MHWSTKYCFFLLILCTTPSSIIGFYSSPVDYCEKESVTESCQSEVHIFARPLRSEESLITYFYDEFNFCPANKDESSSKTWISFLWEPKLLQLPYEISFLKDVKCAHLCQKTYREITQDVDKLNLLKKAISKNYQHHWIVEDMPVVFCYQVVDDSNFCTTGFPLGCYIDPSGITMNTCIMHVKFSKQDTYYLFNHLDIAIKYQSEEEELGGVGFKNKVGRIVQVEIQMRSINHPERQMCSNDLPPMEIPRKFDSNGEIVVNYTYSVQFVKYNGIEWSSRLDYLQNSSTGWYSILNFLVIAFFLSGLIGVIFRRTLHGEFIIQNQAEVEAHIPKSIIMKSLYEDVFRPPEHPILFVAFVTSGLHIFMTTLITLVLASFGVVSPTKNGTLMLWAMIVYAFLSTPVGYICTRIHRALGRSMCIANIFSATVICPSIAVLYLFVSAMLLMGVSNAAVNSVKTYAQALILCIGICVPFEFFGAYIARFKAGDGQFIWTEPTSLPQESKWLRFILGTIIGGFLPFGCMFIQLYFIINSIWYGDQFISFLYLLLTFAELVMICAATSIIVSYYHLRAGDYHWYWHSFLGSSFSAVYLFIYSAYYFFTKLIVTDYNSTALYFSFVVVAVIFFFFLTGSIGSFATYLFMRKVYKKGGGPRDLNYADPPTQQDL